jgi:hypothetical protein
MQTLSEVLDYALSEVEAMTQALIMGNLDVGANGVTELPRCADARERVLRLIDGPRRAVQHANAILADIARQGMIPGGENRAALDVIGGTHGQRTAELGIATGEWLDTLGATLGVLRFAEVNSIEGNGTAGPETDASFRQLCQDEDRRQREERCGSVGLPRQPCQPRTRGTSGAIHAVLEEFKCFHAVTIEERQPADVIVFCCITSDRMRDRWRDTGWLVPDFQEQVRRELRNVIPVFVSLTVRIRIDGMGYPELVRSEP